MSLAPQSLPPSPDAVRTIRLSFVTACIVVLLAEAIALTGRVPAPHELLSINANVYYPFFFYAMGGLFAMHALVRPDAREIARASIVGVVLLALHAVMFGFHGDQAHRLIGLVLYYQGLGSAACLLAKAWRLRAVAQGSDALLLLMAGSTIPLFVLATGPLLALSPIAAPYTLDALAYAFDRSLGFDPSAMLAGFVLKRAALRELALAVYSALPLMIAIGFGMQLRRRDASPSILLVFMAIVVIGFPIYFLYPVTGPLYAFGAAFPDHMPASVATPMAMEVTLAAPRNGMPSLHFAWVFALWLAARNFGLASRLGAGAFLCLTVLAILGLGEHYLVDLVVALPLVLAAIALCAAADCVDRRQALWTGSLMLAGWLGYLTWGATLFAAMGRAHWLAVLATVMVALYQGPRLARRPVSAEFSRPTDTTG
ncbi:MAG: phosphatase PAP2 family protein [Burkholderiaceae bacterium]|nr:phosphatase PAP2 family protein [Sulfuritalea sp.]MCF8173924.1 phosphatase PAP2 family protein [Burkholderiaceae bacterium]